MLKYETVWNKSCCSDLIIVDDDDDNDDDDDGCDVKKFVGFNWNVLVL